MGDGLSDGMNELVASIGVAMQSAGLMIGPVVLPEDFRLRTRPEIAQ
jgi:hypothetical protein